MQNALLKSLLAAAVAVVVLANTVRAADAKATEPLVLQLPAPTLKGTPEDLPAGPNIEPYSDKAPTPLQVPKGVKNVAAGKPVTSSVKPFTGELSQITDGKKEAFDYDSVEMKKGAQWVQVDLGEVFAIYAVAVWHDHRYLQVMHDVIVQVADDPEFKTGVTTLFNNDTDNSAALGVGTDREYFESKFGKAIDGKGVKARYVRGYTKGGTLSALNCWQEIEVYALPASSKTGAGIMPPATASLSQPPLGGMPAPEIKAVDVASTEFKTADAPTTPAIVQTAPTPQPTRSTPTPVNVETTARAQVFNQTPATTQAPVTTMATTPAAAGLNWPTVFLAGLMLIAVLGLIYALARNSRVVPLARAK